ncbi:MAG: hypothetical protein LBK94_05295 [Prevotellaceae bacterium]|jgi:hypothetical protein|nr:hypothetical protein [Prevotellaceae bacterium]
MLTEFIDKLKFKIAKYMFLLLCFSCTFLLSCDNPQKFNKVFKYKDVEIKIPSNWQTYTEDIAQDYGYIIGCGSDKTIDGFLLQCSNLDINLNDQLDILKESLIEKSGYENLIFYDNVVGDYFPDNEAMYSDYTFEYLKSKIYGRLVVFDKGGKTFALACTSIANFDDNKLDKTIISNMQINSSLKEINTQTVKYREVEFEIPATWHYTSKEHESGYGQIITCSDERENNTFIFSWFDIDDDLDSILDKLKEPTKETMEENGNYTELFFSDNKIGIFHDYETMYSDFSGKYLGAKFDGKIIVFADDNKIFSITYLGTSYFYENNIDELILSSIKINNFEMTQL